MKLYISGPMTGLPELSYPAFFAAASDLCAFGYDTFNPAANPEQPSWEDYMRVDIQQVLESDGIAFLPGALKSRGARLELHIAAELGLDIRPLHEWLVLS